MSEQTREAENLETARRYLLAVAEHNAVSFFHPDVVVEVFPNRIDPKGSRRNLAELTASAAQGRKILTWQKYDVRNASAHGDCVSMEIEWTGALAIPLGTLPAGYELRAHVATFLEFREGKIFRQRNYDCYEPW